MLRRDLLTRTAWFVAALTFWPNKLSALGGPVLETGQTVPNFDLPGSSRSNLIKITGASMIFAGSG